MASDAKKDRIIRVLLADDHVLMRKGLQAVLSDEPDIQVLGEAGNGLEAEDMAVRLKPDVIVMDIYMPVRNGLDSIISIKKELTNVKILLLTVSEREEDLVSAMRYGADGYILKNDDVKKIVESVRRVAEGKTALNPYIAQKLVKEMLGKQGVLKLSSREKRVLELLGEGLSNSEIAERLTLSQNTIGSYVYRLLRKLHLNNRAEAIAYARYPKNIDPYL